MTYYCGYPVDQAVYQTYNWSPSTDSLSTSTPDHDKTLAEESSRQSTDQLEVSQLETQETLPAQTEKSSRKDKLKIRTNLNYSPATYNNCPPQSPIVIQQSPSVTNLTSPLPMCNNFNPQSPMYAHLNTQSPIYTSLTQQNPMVINMSHHTPICANLTPQTLNSTVDMYSSMLPLPQGEPILHLKNLYSVNTRFFISVGTPIIYGAAPVPEVPTEMIMPTPPVVFTTPQMAHMDVQYVSPGPFVYPPTPPASWFPPGVNAQGFIFPRPN